MKKIITGITATLLTLTLMAQAQIGTTGSPLLRLGIGAVPTAMGDAYAAMPENAVGLHFNPAVLATLYGPEYSAHYQKRFMDLRVTSMTTAYPAWKGYLGGSINYFSEGQIRETTGGVYTGDQLRSWTSRLMLGYGYPVLPWLEAGISMTWLHSVLAEQARGNSFSTDLGVRVPDLFEHFAVAAVINNLGTGMRYDDLDRDPPPTGLRLGVMHDAFGNERSDLIWKSTADVNIQKGNYPVAGIGSELTFRSFYRSPLDVVFRAGLKGGGSKADELTKLTVGFGLVFSSYALDYSFETFGDLGTTSRISLSFRERPLPEDSDRDGIYDGDDLCPDTPYGARVDSVGCPLDSDGDGVWDGLDQCPNTPLHAIVNQDGCPLDSDGDGVYDGLDKCPNTPAGAKIDVHGCPMDTDSDGVYDGIDLCPNTPMGAIVDSTGCPTDSDADGVLDGIDRCPGTRPRARVDKFGCEVSEQEFEFLETGLLRLNNINFESGKAVLKPESYPELDRLGALLERWNNLRIEIAGHTDSQGAAAYNQQLSEQRAASVRKYLLTHFSNLQAEQLTSVGFGETTPVADNGTPEGRALNRRVEFTILNKGGVKRVLE